jgi:hypothetical protein
MTPNTKATALQERRFNRPSNSPFWAKIRAQMKLHFPNPNLIAFYFDPFIKCCSIRAFFSAQNHLKRIIIS